MNCFKAKKLISPFIDNELTVIEHKKLEEHLESCSKCKNELEELKKIQLLFITAEKFSTPDKFSSRIMANVFENSRKEPEKSYSIPFKVALSFTLILIICIGILSGSILADQIIYKKTNHENLISLEGLNEVFDDSIDGTYLTIMEGNNERQ